jgi:hypothetical protein
MNFIEYVNNALKAENKGTPINWKEVSMTLVKLASAQSEEIEKLMGQVETLDNPESDTKVPYLE